MSKKVYTPTQQDDMTRKWLVILESKVNENKQRKGKRKETTGLVKGPTDSKVRIVTTDGLSKNRRDGRKWGRRSGDRYAQEVISVLNRMQESGEVQGNLRYLGSSSYTFENGTAWRNKDEPS